MANVRHAVICAAGLGSRLGLGTTKCLVDINHKKIIDYQLELLEEVPDVRIVVGFQAKKVVDYVRKIRKDVTFIHNEFYATTSSSYSAHLGTKNLKDPFLVLAGDLLIEQESFFSFLKECESNRSIVGITEAKSEHPIYVDLDQEKRIIGFQVYKNTGFEWPCLFFSNGIKMDRHKKYIFENLFTKLPIKSHIIDCYEVDTKTDLELAVKSYEDRVPFVLSRDRPIRTGLQGTSALRD